MATISEIGFIGAGALTEAVVRGLRTRDDRPMIHLSPRSESVSRALAAAHPNVVRAASNAEVLARSDLVVLAVRPQELDTALAGLAFRPDHVVASFVAMVPTDEVVRLAAPAARVCRVTPLPSIALGQGPIILYPALSEVESLFAGLGDVVVAASEAEIMTLGCASGLLSAFFETERAVAEWLVGRDVRGEAASLYVRAMFAAAAAVGRAEAATDLSRLADAHETKGGLNARGRAFLREAGHFDQIGTALDAVANLSLRASGGVTLGS